jgi:hypothetical protein
MKRTYEVKVTRMVWSHVHLDVQADSFEEAEKGALTHIKLFPQQWVVDDTEDKAEVDPDQMEAELAERPIVTVEYKLGDLNNGHLQTFSEEKEAYVAYKELAIACMQTDRGDETVSYEQAFKDSMDFHYVVKVTTTTRGHVDREDEELLYGGTSETYP